MDVVRDIVRGLRAEIGGRVLYFATTGATLIFLARSLHPDAYGLLFLAMAILSVGQLFGDLAIPESAARYIAEYDELDTDRADAVMTFSFRVVLLTAAVVAALVVVFHGLIAGLFDAPSLDTLLLAGAGLIVCRAIYRYFRKILQGYKSVRLSALVYGTEGIGRLVFVVVFVLLGYGTLGAMGGYIFGFATAAIVGAVAFYRHVYPEIDLTAEADRDTRQRVLRYAVPLVGTRGAKMVDARLDTIALGFFLAPVVVGYYVLSKQAVHLLQAPAASLGFSVGPWFSDQKAAGDIDRIADIYLSSLVYVLLLYVPVTAGLFILARPTMLIVFGRGYLPAVDILQIVSFLVVLRAVEELSENALDYLGRAQARSITKGVTGTATIGLLVVLVPRIGVEGAAIAKVLTHAVYVVTLLYIMKTEIGVRYTSVVREMATIVAITGVMSTVVLLSTEFISGAVTLAVVVALGSSVWVVLTVFTGLVDAQTIGSLVK